MYYRYNIIPQEGNEVCAVDAVITTDKFQIWQIDNPDPILNYWRIRDVRNNQEMVYTLHSQGSDLTLSDMGSGVLRVKMAIYLDNDGIPFINIIGSKIDSGHGFNALWYLDRAGTPTISDHNPIMVYRKDIPVTTIASTLETITVLAGLGPTYKIYIQFSDGVTMIKLHSIPSDQDYHVVWTYCKTFMQSVVYEASDSGNQAVIAAERAVKAANEAVAAAGRAEGAVEILDRSLISR